MTVRGSESASALSCRQEPSGILKYLSLSYINEDCKAESEHWRYWGKRFYMGNCFDAMETSKYTVREAFPQVTEQRDSESKIKAYGLSNQCKTKSEKQEKRDGVG